MKLAIQETFAKRIVNWSSSDYIVDVFNYGNYARGNVLHVNWGNALQYNTLPPFDSCHVYHSLVILTESY